MSSPWIGGLHIHGLDRGETPTADFLCTHCGAHKRVTGRNEVAEFTASDPAADHATRCTAAPDDRPAPTRRRGRLRLVRQAKAA